MNTSSKKRNLARKIEEYTTPQGVLVKVYFKRAADETPDGRPHVGSHAGNSFHSRPSRSEPAAFLPTLRSTSMKPGASFAVLGIA